MLSLCTGWAEDRARLGPGDGEGRESLSGVLASGCDRNIEGFQPGEKASEPDLARIFPGPAAGAAPCSENERGNSRAPDRAAPPPSRAEGCETATTTAADPIEGTIELTDQPGESWPAGGGPP